MIQPDYQSPCGKVSLYCADCMDVLPHLGKVDAVVTDPPFGVGNFVQATGNVRGNRVEWNEAPPPVEFFKIIKKISRNRVIWGAEHFNCFEGHGAFVWDKQQPMQDFSKVEIASKSWGKKTDVFYHRWTNFVNTKVSEHPCERPVALYEWCINQFPQLPAVFLDPFMGSGTTGIAALKCGRKFIGIEKEPKYFEIAKRRICQELDQFKLAL